MKYLKFVVSFIITILFLYIAKNNAMNNPKTYSVASDGYSIEYNSTPKVFEKENYAIQVTMNGQFSDSIYPAVRIIKDGQDPATDANEFSGEKLEAIDSLTNVYAFSGLAGDRGKKTFYYFAIVDSAGNNKLTLSNDENSLTPFTLKYIGHVPIFILVGHILFIFLSIFFIVLATVDTVMYFRGSVELSTIAKHTLMAVICCFVGGYPFGFAMNWYAFNGIWEGVPFGTDATDNKTQLLFVYILFALIALKGSLRKKDSLNLYSNITTAIIALGSFGVMTFVNLIPHSIQFSKSFTEIFCYTFIAIVFLLTLIPIIKPKR